MSLAVLQPFNCHQGHLYYLLARTVRIMQDCNTRAVLPTLPKFDEHRVYAPAEDTYLLLDSLQKNLPELASGTRICLEVGTGSGCVITFLARELEKSTSFFATDVNSEALSVCKRTLECNNISASVNLIKCDGVSAIKERLTSKVDLLVFNPPYVPTAPEEVDCFDAENVISAAWAGGDRGRQVIDRLLPDLVQVLSPTGWFYLVLLKENSPLEVSRILNQQYGLIGELVLKRRAGMEILYVLRFRRRRQ